MPIRKLRAGRVPGVTASQYVGIEGTIFWNESTGELRLSDGETPGGQQLPISIASPTVFGGVKLGPGIQLNNDNQIIIDSTGLDFSFGDFSATVSPAGSATLSSINTNQNIDIVTNGTAAINIVGDLHIHRTIDYDPNNVDFDGAVFAVKADGQIQMKVPLSDSTSGALEIIGNDTGLFVSPNQTGVILHVTGNSALPSRSYFDANQNYVVVAGRRYNGTQLAPTKVLNGDILLRLVAQAATQATTEPATFQTLGPARIEFIATQDQQPNKQGGEVSVYATANNTAATSAVKVATFNGTTGLTATKFNGSVTVGAGNTLDVTGATVTGLTLGGLNPADVAGTMTGTTIKSTVTGSSLTSVGTLTSGSIGTGFTAIANSALANSSVTVNGTSIALGASATVTAAAGTLTGTTLNATVVTSSLTSVGTLGSLSVTNTITAGLFDGKTKRNVRDAGTIADAGTVTIDFLTDDVVLFVWANGVTLAYANYTAGRIVRVIARKATGTGVDQFSLGGVTAANVSSGVTNFSGSQDTSYFIELTCVNTTLGSVYVKL